MSQTVPPTETTFRKWLSFLALFFVFVIVAWILVSTSIAGKTRIALDSLWEKLFITANNSNTLAPTSPVLFREFWSANHQHLILANAVGRCFEQDIVDARNPLVMRQALLTGLKFDGGYWRKDEGDALEAVGSPSLPLTAFQRAVIQLSDATSRARIQTAAALVDSQDRRESFQLWTVLLGALSTLLIGVRSYLKNDGVLTNAVSLGAIGIAALTTVFASMGQFYSADAVYARSQLALDTLKGMHTERVLLATAAVDLCDKQPLNLRDTTDLRARIVNAWMAKLAPGNGQSSTPEASGTALEPFKPNDRAKDGVPPQQDASPGTSSTPSPPARQQ